MSSMSFVALVAISALVHVVSLVQFPDWRTVQKESKKSKIKVKYVKKQRPKTPENDKKILEAKMKETKKPDEARYKGYQDHAAKKETKTKRVAADSKGLDPGQAGIHKAKKTKKRVAKTESKNSSQKVVRKKKLKTLTSPSGRVSISSRPSSKKKSRPRSNYQKLLPDGNDLQDQVIAGYQDYIQDDIEISDSVDINTTNYRYIGYFTMMRKAIQLVWNYPASAQRRQQQGVVGLQFTIHKNGAVSKVKVLSSSGYKVLDDAIVDAIQLASPFAPLPSGFGKKKMTITGSFSYVMNSYAGY